MLNVAEKINEMMKITLAMEDIKLDGNIILDEIGIDSIEKVELLVKLQKLFSIHLKFDEFRALNTLGEVYAYVERRLQ